MILGIDPGNEQSGWCLVNVAVSVSGGPVLSVGSAGKDVNERIRERLAWTFELPPPEAIVIENIQSYGGAVGRSTFDTCIEIGRFVEVGFQCAIPVILIPRPEYVRWHCDGARKVNDSVLRQALLLKYGGDRKGEPLHMLKGGTDKRSAFAVAAYAIEAGKLPEVSE